MEKVKLGDVFNVARGGSPRPIQEYITEAEDGINWIMIGDTSSEKFITTTKNKIKPEGVKKSRMVYSGDFLLTNSMSFGRPYILKIDGCIHDGWLVLSPKNKEKISTDYFYYFLGSNNLKKDFEKVAAGAVVKNLNSEIVRNIQIPLPSLTEQKAIAEKLDKAQEIICYNEEIIAKYDALTQSLFLDMFGDPVKNKKGWDFQKLSKVAPFKKFEGIVNDFEGKYWLLNLDMISSNTGQIISKLYVEKEEIGNSTISFNEKQVLYSKLRPYLNKVVLPDRSGYATTELVPLNPEEKILNRNFLFSLLTSKFFVNYIEEKVAGAKMPRVNMDTLRDFNTILPPITLQNQFAERVSAIEAQKQLAQKSLEQSQNLFNSLLQQSFKN